MIHSYDAQTTIELPRVDVPEAITVGRGLVAELGAHKKPAQNLAAAIKYVERASDDLQAALFSAAEAGGDPTYLTQLRAASGAWSSAYTWVQPFTKVSDPAKARLAQQILATIYPDGVRFVRLATPERWIEAEQRIQAIGEKKLAPAFEALGGSVFLADILGAHKTLGAAAGITAPRGVSAKSGVPAAFDRWKAAVRGYVTQVVANQALALLADAGDAAATEQAERLLRPLTEIETTRAAPAEKGGEGSAADKKGSKKDEGKKAKEGAGEEKEDAAASALAAEKKPAAPSTS